MNLEERGETPISGRQAGESTEPTEAKLAVCPRSSPWRLWWAQILAILRLEVRKSLVGKRAIIVYLLAATPIILFAGHSFAVAYGFNRCRGTEDFAIFAGEFQIYYLRLGIFFGCVATFMNLFRGEVLEKTLHHYLLAPVRREVLVAGKFLSGLLASVVLFGAGTLGSFLIVASHVAQLRNQEFLADPLPGHLAAYMGVTVLACLGYGAVFLMLGMLVRNPIIPAVAVLIWESITIFLPPLLKQISVIYYLESLCPVRVPFRGANTLFAISGEPVSAWLAVPGLILLAAVAIFLSALRIRRLEVNYGTE